MAAEGTYQWGQDNWYYVVQRGRWVRTIYYRTFPDRNNVYLYDMYANGRYVGRRDDRAPRPTPAPTPQEAVQIQRLNFLLLELQKALANSRPMLPANIVYPGMTGTIGGMRDSASNVNLMTIDSVNNERTGAAPLAALIHYAVTGR